MNKIQRQKGILKGLMIAVIILAAAMIAGGVVLLVFGAKGLTGEGSTLAVIQLVCGILLTVLGFAGVGFGVYWLAVANAVKATKGSVADPCAVKGTVNGKVCPVCGATNTPDVTECTVCGAELSGDQANRSYLEMYKNNTNSD